jgi:predicted phage baseplate assembly protein
MRYIPVGPALPDGSTASEYDGDAGDTIRFGDGSFGAIPDTTATFTVLYRSGGGAAGNVAAGATFTFDPSASVGVGVTLVTNPFAATGGNDPESDASIRRRAPHAFRAKLARAPLAADYERYAKQRPWVQRANTVFRFTGSWLTAFTAPDPVGTETLSVDNEIDLLETLDRVRMAGRDSQARAPLYRSLDVLVILCAKPDAFRGDVESGVLAALSSAVLPDGTKGYFHPDNFTFGQALRRGTLEAAIQAVPGVHGVVWILYRPRRVTSQWAFMPPILPVAPWEIIQVDSNPSRPERGIVQVVVEGGK